MIRFNQTEKGLDVLRYAKLLSCLLLILCLTAAFAVADTSGFTFTLNSAKTGYIVQKYSGSAAEVVVPDTYEGLPVTEIGEGAFENNASLKTVSLPSSIMRIGKRAFKNCSKLANVKYYQAGGTAIRIPGDADDNGFVDMNDALLVLQYAAGQSVTINASNADVNGDAKVDMSDALLLLQHQAGWQPTLK